MTQASTGVAGTKNWLVNGMIRAVPYKIGMSSLSGKGGVVIRVSQNVARRVRKVCSPISVQVNLWARNLANVTAGENEKLSWEAALRKSWYKYQRKRGTALRVGEGMEKDEVV